MIKKILSWLMVVCLLLSYIPTAAFATENGDGNIVVNNTEPVLPEYVVLPEGVTVESFGDNTVTDGNGNYYATLQAAVEAVCGNSGAVLYCKPEADVGSLQHAPVISTLTIYGNGAAVTGGNERDFDIGNTDPSGGKDITADMTLTVKNLDGCGAWGAKATEHTVNLVFENCANMGKVLITGTTGTLNILLKACAFEGVIAEAVYSNANGAIEIINTTFKNLNKAINLNHKVAGEQIVTLTDCTFTNCGKDVAADQIPVRVLSSVADGKSVLTVSGCTFTGTPAGGADILLPAGNGTTEATISGTAANVSDEGKMVEVKADETYTNVAPTQVEVGTLDDLQTALAADNNLPIVVTAEIEIPAGATVELDLNGKTVTSVYQTGSTTKHIYPLNVYGNLTIKDSKGDGSIAGRGILVQADSKLTIDSGSIYAIDSNGGSALFMYGGDVVINGGHIEQKAEGTYNFAIQAPAGTVTVNGGWVGGNHGTIAATGGQVVINDGTLVCTGSAGMTDNVVYSSGDGSITINGGNFIADKDIPSGGTCVYDANGGATINGGTFGNSSGGDVWGTTGTTIKGGKFENLTEKQHIAEGYAALPTLDGKIVVGSKPTATVNNLGMTTIPAEGYVVYGNGDRTKEMPLSFVMQFLADQDEEDMATSPFADWYGDFVITFTGIKNGSFIADGCYLAGYYGDFGWVKVPVDGMTITEGARYPVMLGVGLGQKYDYICSGVQDFKCALYLTPEILAMNPGIQVKLELAVVDNSQGSDAAASALSNNEKVYTVTKYTYDAEDFVIIDEPKVEVENQDGKTVDVVIADKGNNSYDVEPKDKDFTMPAGGVVMTFPVAETAEVAFVVHKHETAEGKLTNYIYVGKVENGNITITNTVGFSTFTVNAGGLADAIAAAQNGDTIVLMDDLTIVGETFTIPADKSITLDMNGKKITATDNKAANVSYELFYIYGELTVAGNGTIELTSTSNDTAWAKSSTIFHNRGGKLIIENGTFKHLGGTAMAYVVDNNANSYGDATTYIKGGTLTSAYIGIRNRMDTYGANGGGNGVATLNVIGGEIAGKYAVWGQVSSVGVKGAINVTGGKLTSADGKAALLVDDDATGEVNVAVSGGTFSSDVSEFVADGFKLEQNADGTYGIVEKTIDGTGTEEDPFIIDSLEALKWFRDSVNAGTNFDNQFVKLTADIDLNSERWTPIGNGTNKFLGTFDGDNHTISNLVVDVNTNNAGLFGFASVVKNVKLVNAKVSGVISVGALVGELESSVGTVENCHVSGLIQITGENSVGGLVGKGYANIKNCSVVGNADSFILGVYGTTEEGDNVGGIIGHLGEGNTLGVANSIVQNIKVSGTRKVGGLVGTTARGNDFVGNTVEGVTVECTATVEYANSNASTTTIGGIIGNYFGSATSGGILKDSTVSNVTFIIGNAKSAGALVGGDRVNNGGAPVGVETSGSTVTNVTGATNNHLLPLYVAQIGEQGYTTLAEAIAAANGGEVEILCDITEELGNISNVTLTTKVAEGVTITNTYTGWTGFDNVTVGAGVTVASPKIFSSEGENTILGKLVVGSFEEGTYYHGYDAKTTVKDGGSLVINGTTILRYNKNAESGLYIYGDGNKDTVEYDCAYYIGAYSGTFYAEDATIEVGYFLLKNSYDNATYADIDMTLDNSTLTVVSTTDTQDSFIIDDQAHLTLKNGAAIADVRDFNVLSGTNLTLSVDETSSISAANMNIAEGVPFEKVQNPDGSYGMAPAANYVAFIGEQGYATLAEAIAAVKEGETITILAGTIEEGSIMFPATLKNVTIKGEEGAVLKNTSLGSFYGSAVHYENITIDGIVFDGSQIVFTGARGGEVVYKNWTITNCEFKNIVSTGNSAIHFNLASDETFEGLTFTNNVIDGVSGGSISGLRANYLSGDITITGNKISNVAWNAIQLINANVGTYTIENNVLASGAGEGILNLYNTTATTLSITNNQFLVNEGQAGIGYLSSGDVSGNYWGGEAPANLPEGLTCSTYYATANADGTLTDLTEIKADVAKIGDVTYKTLAEAAAAAQAGDEIIILADVEEDVVVPAGIIFNGNGKQVGVITAAGEITFKGHTKATNFGTQYTNTTINIGEGACLEITGTGRLVIGHGCTFNITGTITDAKTADKATIQPSLIMPGASFTGAGVTFNVTNAYITAPSSYCSSSKSASGTFDFNITNSIVETAGKLAFEAQSTAATVNFELKDSVLTTGSHLVFGVSRGEIVIDNSNVNVGKSNQIENQSTMTIKNGSVVNGAVATSSNAKNPGTIIVDNATYAVTGEFSGSDLGIGTIIVKNGATVSAGSITKANIQIDATGMQTGDVINLTADLSKLAGTVEVINNDKLEAKLVDGKIVLAEKPVAMIGETGYATIQAAINAAQTGDIVVILPGEYSGFDISNKNITIQGTLGANGEYLTVIKGGNPAITGHGFNGTIKDLKIVDAFKVMYAEPAGNVTVDNVYVTGATYGFHLVAYSQGLSWTIQNSYMDLSWANSFGVYDGGDAAIVIKGNEFVSTNPYYPDYGALPVNTFLPDVTVEGNVFGENAKINIDASITDTSKINISKNYHADGVNNAFVADSGVKTPILEYYADKTMTNLVKVCVQIGDTYYATLAEAFAAAQNGDVIVLLADVAISETIKVNANVTLDLNGKTITGTDNSTGSFALFEIQPGKEFTVKGDGKITLTATNNRGWGGYSSVISNQRGKLIVNGGTLEHLGGTDMAYAIDNLTNGKGTYAETVINGGTIKSPYRAIRQFLNGTKAQNILTVNGGTIEGANKAIWMQGANTSANNGALTVAAGANIKGNIYLDTAAGTAEWPVTIAVAASALSGESTIIVDENVPGKYQLVENNGTYSIEIGLVGSGTEEDPYLISTLEDLILFRDSVNAGETKYNASGVYVALAADIDLAGIDWSVNIGDACNTTFDGIFDGKDHTIKNLTSTETAQTGDGYICTGLFGAIYGSAQIRNLTIENVNINVGDYTGNNVGAVVGFVYEGNGAVIENIHVIGNININAPKAYGVGAIVGYAYYGNSLTIKDCSVEANDGSAITASSAASGIIGYSSNYGLAVENCNVKGVALKATAIAGGLAGVVTCGNFANNTVENVTITVTGANWKNSAAIAVGTLASTSVTVSGTTYSNVNVTDIVGSQYAEHPTTPVDKVQAKIGDKYFYSFAAAYAAAQADDTIVLLAPIVVAKGETLTLDKDVTITYTSNAVGEDMITVRGTLNVAAGKITYTNTDKTGNNVTVSTISCEPGSVLNVTGGTIENKTVYSNGSYAYAIDMLTNGSMGDVTATISGGKVYSDYMAIRQFNNSTACKNSLTVTGGEIYGAKRAIQVHLKNDTAYLEISGGVIEAGEGGYALCIFPENATNIAVSGGEFVGEVYSGTNGFISGGIFDEEVYGDYLVEGYVCVKNENGTYGVEVFQANASIDFNEVALLLKDEVKIKFYLIVDGITGDTIPNAGIEIWSADDYDPNNLTNPTTVKTGLVKNGSRYQIVGDGIPAKNMGDLIYVRAYIEVNGVKVYSRVISTSPVKYCEYHIGRATKDPTNQEKMDTAKLCISLMNYGAEAQKYFAENSDYTYDTLMNSFITDEQRAWVDSSYNSFIATEDVPAYAWTTADTSNIKLHQLSVVLTGAPMMKLTATVGVSGTVKMWYWTEDTAGEELLIENAIEMANIGLNGSYYQGYVQGVAAKNMGDTVYMCATVEENGVTYYTKAVALSVHKYAEYMISNNKPEAALAEALVIYSNVAKEYMTTYNPQE